jgi:hypothetical protein
MKFELLFLILTKLFVGGPYILCPENIEFDSLQDLVDEKNFRLPCPGSRFQLLFQEINPLEGYIGTSDSTEIDQAFDDPETFSDHSGKSSTNQEQKNNTNQEQKNNANQEQKNNTNQEQKSNTN